MRRNRGFFIAASFVAAMFAFALGESVSAVAQSPASARSLVSSRLGASGDAVAAAADGGSSAEVIENADPAESLPSMRGWDAFLAYSANHDSSSGWANVVSPSVAYRFNSIFSADASLPLYLSLNAYKADAKPKKGKTPKLKSLRGELGDAVFSTHAELHPHLLDYTATVSVSAPTGDTAYGLSPGRPTWNENNHFERSAGPFTPDVEVGIGDNATLTNRRVKKNYTSLGILAYFQVGSSVNLPLHLGLDVEAYEQLPIGSQKVYTTVIRKKKRVQVLTASGDAEDNGINISLDTPLGRHVSANADYSRSLRLGLDTAGLGLTYRFHALAPPSAVAARKDGWATDERDTIF